MRSMVPPDPDRLIADAYDAAVDNTLWHAWSENLTRFLGGVGSVFFALGVPGRSLESVVKCSGPATELMDEYTAGWWQFDPQMAMATGLKRSGIYLDTDHVDLTDRNVAEYVRWQRDKGGFDHHMTAVALLGASEMRAGISVHRGVADGHTPQSEREKLGRLFPEIVRSMELGYRYADMLQSAYWDGLIVGRPDQAAILVDECGRVIRYTDVAGNMLTRNDGLTIAGRRLVTMLPSGDNALQAVIARAITSDYPVSGATRILRESGRAPLILICYPLRRTMRMLAPAEAAALIIVVDPGQKQQTQKAIFRQAFGLTTREAEMAAALMDGHSIGSAAASLKLGMPTARTHMRRLFEKTGTPGQGALIRLLGRIV